MIKIKNIPIGDGFKPFIVAEVSANHSGSLKNALLLIKKAKECGADAVKFQTYTPEEMTLNSRKKGFVIKEKSNLWKGQKLFDLYRRNHTPVHWHKKLFSEAKKRKIIAFSTPFSVKAVDILEKLNVPCYKIGSFEMSHFPLLKRISKTKKPIILSTGMATFSEIKDSINFLKKNGSKKIIILKCTSSYPAEPKSMNLLTIKNLKKKFNYPIGLSDHNVGMGPAISSVFLGSNLIEKHFTLSKKNKSDGKFSLDPKELKFFVQEINNSWLSLGKVFYGITKEEKGSSTRRRSLFTKRSIKKGEKFTESNIDVLRPNLGIHPKYYFKILGKRSKKKININMPIKMSAIK